jgi:hypothetical protein
MCTPNIVPFLADEFAERLGGKGDTHDFDSTALVMLDPAVSYVQ